MYSAFFVVSEYSKVALMSVRFRMPFTFLIFAVTVVLLNAKELSCRAPIQSASVVVVSRRCCEKLVAHVAIIPAIAIVNAISNTAAIRGEIPFF